jgi:hypothetical protein
MCYIRRECQVESVKSIRYWTSGTRNALLEVAENFDDWKVKSKAQLLVNYENQNFESLFAMVVWYDVLFAVNTVRKTFQFKEVQLDVAVTQIKALTDFLLKYRETEFTPAKMAGTEIA